METHNKRDFLDLTAQIVAAHVSHNTVPLSDVSLLIEQVHRTLAGLRSDSEAPMQIAERPQPAVPIKNSITDEFLVCLEDGKRLKMLKRHLRTSYEMTPEQYRERWGLPSDYPMVALNYAQYRSLLAKKIGLGTKPRKGRQKRAAA